jgi:hypothetical protein
MTDKVFGSMVRAFFKSKLRIIPAFSSHGDEGKLTEDIWMVGGRSKFEIGGKELFVERAIIRHLLLDVGGLTSGSRTIAGGSSKPKGVPISSGLPAGSEMLL